MNLEIERKFLVRDDRWREAATNAQRLRQAWLANTGRCSVRVRSAEDRGWISVKSMRPGRCREEYEYAIPVADAKALFGTLAEGPAVEKLRHAVPAGRHRFELDEFEGANRGLVIAEIELESAEEVFERPDWLGDEVTDDIRFYNFRLAAKPFVDWPGAWREAVARGRAPPGDGS